MDPRCQTPLVLLPYKLDSNIYVRELGRAYRALGSQVVFGFENMFEPALEPQLLHLQWPELYRSAPAKTEQARADYFLDAIDAYRKCGAKIAWTVHNLTPHERSADNVADQVYQGVIDRSDLILHHCVRSSELLASKYRIPGHVTQIITPHGHYLGYPHGIGKEEARRWLGIPKDAFVYLHFGNIRGYKGLDDLFEAFDQVSHPNKWLLVAGKYTALSGAGGWRDRFLMWRKRRFGRRMTLSLFQVPDERIQYFVAGSDSVVLSHRHGLNSGVGVLGMTFGRPVVGPDMGCIGEMLASGANVTYRPGDVASLAAAMEQVTRTDPQEAEQRNIAVASSWTWTHMAQQVLTHPTIDLRTDTSSHSPAGDGGILP